MKPIQYRQGDVLIEHVANVVRKSKNKKLTRIVLAEGEATGHAHVLQSEYSADWWKDGERQFANVPAPAVIVHEEHSTVTIEEGTHEIIHQREYSPEEIRRVQD